MKSQILRNLHRVAALAVFALLGACCISTAHCGDGPAPSAKQSAGITTNSTSAEAIPQSVFTPSEGRNPFFPSFAQHIQPPVQSTNRTVTPSPTFELTLQGISGPPDHRLAIIGGRTFAEGETNEVPTSGGRQVQVRCLKINETSAVIEIGGVQHTLRFQSQN